MTTKPKARKQRKDKVCDNSKWVVVFGELTRPQGRPRTVSPLFKCVGEKIPFEFLREVKDHLEEEDISSDGLYAAHDSMGVVRYVGRGNIFLRLRQRKSKFPLELEYF